jgi:CMP-N,N'-diacetyllegionaminic acid synthase
MEFHESKRYTDDKKQKVALVDIDETICFYSSIRRYDLSEPHYDNIAKINGLYDEGWKIVYWTARGSVSGRDYREHTLKQLKEWGCKYHELCIGRSEKPHFDLVIDDKAKRIEEL